MATEAVQTQKIAEQWLLKDEAAKALHTNPRTIERYARMGMVQRRYLPKQPNERQARVVFLRSDLENLQKGSPGQSPVSLAKQTGQVEAWGALATHLAKLSEAYPARKEWPPWLTLDQAVVFSNLTRAWLLREAGAGDGIIRIRDMGKHARGGRWRFFRDDLEQAE
jgi:hypothetical protein